ncbi:MAG: hypothetical protein ACPHBQ_04325, partial [Candidatus Poseidoniaceae archaeon]
MELLSLALSAIIASLIVWFIMNRKINQTSIELASIKATEKSVRDTGLEMQNAMKDTFQLLAQSAFEQAVAKADSQKESSFKEATNDLHSKLTAFNENINRFERESIQRDTSLKGEISAVAKLGLQLSE